MTEYHTWSCDFCGTIYPSRAEAELCEKGHHRPKSIVNGHYAGADSQYPDHLWVDFPNNITRIYTLTKS